MVGPASLRTFVREDKYDEVKAYVQQAKQDKEHWWFDSSGTIGDACRDAVLLDRRAIVQLFLDEGLSANSYARVSDDREYICPLSYFAAKVGNLSMLQLLVQKGAKIRREDHSDREQQQALITAIENGRTEVVEYLLDNGGEPNGIFRGLPDLSFLAKAAIDGQEDIVRLLIGHGANVKAALLDNYENFRKRHYWGVTDQEQLPQYSQSVQMLLDCAMGTNFNETERRDGEGCDALAFLRGVNVSGFNFVGVSVYGRPLTRKDLIDRNIIGADKAILTCGDIAQMGDTGRRQGLRAHLEAMIQSQGRILSQEGIVNLVPLADAAKEGQEDVVLVRLSAGVSPNQQTTSVTGYTETAIAAAAREGALGVVRLLAEHPQIIPSTCVEAAQVANGADHGEIFEYLRSLMDVNEKDSKGNAPIHNAVEAHDIAEIEKLCARGANINLENSNGCTPLYIAARHSYGSEKAFQVLECLLQHHADPNMYRYWDYSPLYAAAKNGDARAVALLLPVTEKREIKDHSGEEEVVIPWYVPLMYESYGHKDWIQILRLLKERGADFNATQSFQDETLLHLFMRHFPSFTDIQSKMRNQRSAIVGYEDRIEPNLLQKYYKKHVESCKTRVSMAFQQFDFLLENGAGPTIACEDRLNNSLQKYYEKRVESCKTRVSEALQQLDFLLENGADPTIACGESRSTPLHVFLKKISLEFIPGATEQIIDRFLSHGVDINTPDSFGDTPLRVAERSGDITATTYLLKKNGNSSHTSSSSLHSGVCEKSRAVAFVDSHFLTEQKMRSACSDLKASQIFPPCLRIAPPI